MRVTRLYALLLSLIVAACGSAAGNAQGDASSGSEDGDASSGSEASDDSLGVRITVLSTRAIGRLGEIYSGPADRFVVLDVRVENRTVPAPIPVVFPLFALRTISGVEYLASEETLLLSAPCDGGAQVTTGGSFECSLAFTIPHADEAAALVYRTAPDVEAVVEFEAPTCEPCGDDCVDLQSNSDHCGACFATVDPDQTCEDGQPTCHEGLALCAGFCVDLQTNSTHCGACFNSGPDCVDGEITCPPGADWCGEVCRYLSEDDANCGACGKACSPDVACVSGACLIEVPSNSTTTTCTAICAAEGLGCAAGSARYYGPLYCIGGGGGVGESNWLGFGCDTIPEPEYILKYGNGCTFFGDVSSVSCTCVEP